MITVYNDSIPSFVCPLCASTVYERVIVQRPDGSSYAALVRPNGQRQEFSFGNPSGADLAAGIADGGAHLELKVAPDHQALEKLAHELEAAYDSHGPSLALVEAAFSALGNLDALGDLHLHGRLVGPDGEPHAVELDLGHGTTPGDLDHQRMLDQGGAQLELGLVPGPDLMKLAELALTAPEALRLLQFGFENPDKLKFLDQAINDPNLMPLVEKAVADPDFGKLLQDGLENPALLGLLNGQLGNAAAGKLLNLFGGKADAPPTPAPAPAPQSETAPASELESLQKELADQRALLEAILRKLESE